MSYASTTPKFHSDLILDSYALLATVTSTVSPISLDGSNLKIPHIVAVARYGAKTTISFSASQALIASLETLEKKLADGDVIYGVNTQFGGTADVRTNKPAELQHALVRELHYGILPPGPQDSQSQNEFQHNIDTEMAHLPRSWTRATLLIRINTLLKGCSGVRPLTVQRLQDLLRHDITPMVPLRGSISASGDLSPLSYLAGAIQGKPTIRVLSRDNQASNAKLAFAKFGLEGVELGAKEGLAIVNGTAVSAAAAALVIHDANTLAVLSQLLTAMSVEALGGTIESFDPFFAETRPHPGQIESSGNILSFLSSSSLTKVNTGADASLRQDRYSIRTAAQWVGPVLEDLVLAHQQIVIEANSATDNPLITPAGTFIHGGNFQAKAITSAMEKTRLGLQSIGRMLFSQCTELINPSTSRGLPPNLVAEDPSASLIFKGTDLHIAALTSELGFLANPVNHVMTAEMGNQSLNSLALISARYTETAVEVLSQLAAVHLVALCQALDLRVLVVGFFEAYRPQFSTLLYQKYSTISLTDDLFLLLWNQVLKSFDSTVSLDASSRFTSISKSLRNTFIDHPSFMPTSLSGINEFTLALAESMEDAWCKHRDAYLAHGDASPLLGMASRVMYGFVREELGVPFLCTERIRTPKGGDCSMGEEGGVTVGSYNGVVYRAVRDGRLGKVAIGILGEARGLGKEAGANEATNG
ncbi:Phenylalanine/tyrosine ammonia-lyase [Lachnellula arida]|uniref:Phenylalanine/tyrosine ammonia-lyase n=1 Tax=Lachnellula arida TaxID=1316785 RepID=A0A8T9BQA8_9HELO|nr:Phenylalanine/tyrosine ammonia-lyase [Lachnellula arida]